MLSSERTRRLALDALRILVMAACYYLAGRIGLLRQVTVQGSVVTPLWPATGVALSFLLWMGLRIWPGIAIGALLIIETISTVQASTLVILAGNTLAPVCSYLLLGRVGFRTNLARVRDGLALVFLGALGGMLISATVATCLLAANGKLPATSFWPVWTAWWAGDAMGVLVFTPLLLMLRRLRLRLPRTAFRAAEAVALFVVAVIVTLVATRSSLSLLFLVYPLLVWAALRFELSGSAPCVLLVSAAAIWAATDQAGPFSDLSLMQGMVTLQAFNGSAALTALLLSSVVTEQRHMRGRIEDACLELADLVDRLAPGTSTAAGWPLDDGSRHRGQGPSPGV